MDNGYGPHPHRVHPNVTIVISRLSRNETEDRRATTILDAVHDAYSDRHHGKSPDNLTKYDPPFLGEFSRQELIGYGADEEMVQRLEDVLRREYNTSLATCAPKPNEVVAIRADDPSHERGNESNVWYDGQLIHVNGLSVHPPNSRDGLGYHPEELVYIYERRLEGASPKEIIEGLYSRFKQQRSPTGVKNWLKRAGLWESKKRT